MRVESPPGASADTSANINLVGGGASADTSANIWSLAVVTFASANTSANVGANFASAGTSANLVPLFASAGTSANLVPLFASAGTSANLASQFASAGTSGNLASAATSANLASWVTTNFASVGTSGNVASAATSANIASWAVSVFASAGTSANIGSNFASAATSATLAANLASAGTSANVVASIFYPVRVYVHAGEQTVSDTTPVTASGLQFTLAANNFYKFEFNLLMRTGTNSVGPRITITYPTATNVAAYAWGPMAADGAANTFRGEITAASDAVVFTSVPGLISASTPYFYKVEGVVNPTAGGNLALLFANETGTVPVRVMPGSNGILWNLTSA